MTKRLVTYMVGIFIMTLGISFSVKSNLGVSPVSSVPYMFTLIVGIEMGKATTMFHSFLILLQILLLRKGFKLINLSQLVVALIFGYLTTFSNSLMSFLPIPQSMVIRLLMLAVSILLVATGIFLYMPADIMPMSPEGLVKAISDKTGIPVPKVKVGFDTSLVLISGAICLTVLGNLGSVGIGTLLSALLTGTMLSVIMKLFGGKLKAFTSSEKQQVNNIREA